MAESYPKFPENFLRFEGEKVLVVYPGNRRQSWYRQVGGRLYLTNFRIMFCPNKMEQFLAAKEWWGWRKDVIGASPVGRQWIDLLGGGGRKRMRVSFRDGPSELFVVNGPDRVVEEVERWRSDLDT